MVQHHCSLLCARVSPRVQRQLLICRRLHSARHVRLRLGPEGRARSAMAMVSVIGRTELLQMRIGRSRCLRIAGMLCDEVASRLFQATACRAFPN